MFRSIVPARSMRFTWCGLRFLRAPPVWRMNRISNNWVSVCLYRLSLVVSCVLDQTEDDVLKQEASCWLWQHHRTPWAALLIPPHLTSDLWMHTHTHPPGALIPVEIMSCLPKTIHMEISSYAGLTDILDQICDNGICNYCVNSHYKHCTFLVLFKPHWYAPTCILWLHILTGRF